MEGCTLGAAIAANDLRVSSNARRSRCHSSWGMHEIEDNGATTIAAQMCRQPCRHSRRTACLGTLLGSWPRAAGPIVQVGLLCDHVQDRAESYRQPGRHDRSMGNMPR